MSANYIFHLNQYRLLEKSTKNRLMEHTLCIVIVVVLLVLCCAQNYKQYFLGGPQAPLFSAPPSSPGMTGFGYMKAVHDAQKALQFGT